MKNPNPNDTLDPNLFEPTSFTWLANRACSLKCPSCVIPHMSFNDMPQPRLYDVMDRVKEKFPNLPFWCVLGGDALDLPDPVEFVRELSQRDVFYAITSHSGFPDPGMPERMMKAGLTNWSVSIDDEERLKTQCGFAAIDTFQKLGLKDIHATLTIDKTNVNKIIPLVHKLDGLGVWSEVTPYIWSKDWHKGPTRQYDFGTGKGYRAKQPDINRVLDELIRLKLEGKVKLHNLLEYYQLWKSDYEQEFRYSYPHGLVIDNDGAYRHSLHVRGEHISKFTIFDDVSKEALMDAWKKDEAQHHQGSLWNCVVEAELVYNVNESVADIKAYYNHGGMPVERAAA